MSKVVKKNKSDNSKEYPVIYTYIYEREVEDIMRLRESVKNKTDITRLRGAEIDTNRVIIGFKFEENQAVPIYKDAKAPTANTLDKKPAIAKMTVKAEAVMNVKKASSIVSKAPKNAQVKTSPKLSKSKVNASPKKK